MNYVLNNKETTRLSSHAICTSVPLQGSISLRRPPGDAAKERSLASEAAAASSTAPLLSSYCVTDDGYYAGEFISVRVYDSAWDSIELVNLGNDAYLELWSNSAGTVRLRDRNLAKLFPIYLALKASAKADKTRSDLKKAAA